MQRLMLTWVILFASLLGNAQSDSVYFDMDIEVGAEQLGEYLPLLKDKKVAIVGNQTTMMGRTHLVDTLLSLGINIKKVFAPEHGFRGVADAGAWIKDGNDQKTGLPVVSMYGKNKKPSSESLSDVDVIIFDMQDVGARFYTYISSMHYVMQAAAENDKRVIILDRPNPNGHYVDGPLLESEFKSFIGMHSVPIVHGMTIGEYAGMINEEKWIGEKKCSLTVVKCANYDHTKFYKVPIKPSPNLPNMASIYLYPSICLFEGTDVSVGRGTSKPFQIIGKPGYDGELLFTPKSVSGATNPKHKGVECSGYDLSSFGRNHMRNEQRIYLNWLVSMYRNSEDKDHFFKSSGSFNLLCGTRSIRNMLEDGKDADEIAASWKADVDQFKLVRKKYLLYKDFE